MPNLSKIPAKAGQPTCGPAAQGWNWTQVTRAALLTLQDKNFPPPPHTSTAPFFFSPGKVTFGSRTMCVKTGWRTERNGRLGWKKYRSTEGLGDCGVMRGLHLSAYLSYLKVSSEWCHFCQYFHKKEMLGTKVLFDPWEKDSMVFCNNV